MGLTAPDIDALIERMAQSGALTRGSRRAQLLKYLLLEDSEGRGERIKAFSIATDVLGRGAEFDPQSDSIVRVEMVRLRSTLDLYFARAGSEEPFRVFIPKGSYCPQVDGQLPASVLAVQRATGANMATSEPLLMRGGPQGAAKQSMRASFHRFRVRWALPVLAAVVVAGLIGVLVSALNTKTPRGADTTASITPNPPANSIGIVRFSVDPPSPEGEKLANQLWLQMISSIRTRALLIRDLTDQLAQADAHARPLPVQQIAMGKITLDSQAVPPLASITVSLRRARDDTLIWSETVAIENPASPSGLGDLARKILTDLTPHVLSETKKELQRRPIASLTPVELFLLGSWFPGYAENSLKWEMDRLDYAERALASEPNFGPAHSVMADKLAYLANYLPEFDTPEMQAKASWHADMAMLYAPEDPSVVFNVALHNWHRGRIEEASRMMRRVVELNRGNNLALFMAEAMPMTCRAVSDSEMQEVFKRDAEYSSDNPVRWVTQSWIARLYLNGEQDEAALRHGLAANDIFSSPDTILLVAAIATHRQTMGEAREIIRKRLLLWPKLDVAHYVQVALPRRCATPLGQQLARYYGKLL